MRRVGFWAQTATEPREGGMLWPVDLVDPAWDRSERATVIAYLRAGREHASYRGMSECRCCGAFNGSQDLTDGTWLWPEGLAHYLDAHDVRPPRDFVDYVLALTIRRNVP